MSSDGEERSIDSNDQSDIDSESSDDFVRSDDETITGQRMLEDDEERLGWWNAFEIENGPDIFDDHSIDFGEITKIKGRGNSVMQLTEEDWRRMGEDLRGSRRLSSLKLRNYGLTEERIRALFGEGRTHVKSLTMLSLGQNPLGQSGLAALLPIVKTVPSLKYLYLYDANLDDNCAVMLSEALSEIHVKKLNLEQNAIGDRGVQSLLPSVHSHHSLRSIGLGDNNIGREGYEAIAQLLSGNQTLEELSVIGATEESAKRMIDSMSSQSKIRRLQLNTKDPESGKDMTYGETTLLVRKLICPSGFDALCNANHSLSWVGEVAGELGFAGPAVETAFEINARAEHGASTTAIIRSKLRTFYFGKDFALQPFWLRPFSVQPFVEMGVNLFPHALELVTRTELRVDEGGEIGSGKYYEVASDNLDGIFRLVRNCHLPEVFSFRSPESKVIDLVKKNEELVGKGVQLQERNAALEADNASLKEENERLLAEIESLRAGSDSVPNKRARPSGE